MSHPILGIAWAVGGIAAWLGASAATAAAIGTAASVAVTVGAAAYSVVYQRKQQKKAQAAAERMRKQQAKAFAELGKKQKKLDDFNLGDLSFDLPGTAATVKDVTVMIRRSTASRRITYGRQRVGGIWVYAETTGAENEIFHLVMALGEGPIDAVESIYFDDDKLEFDADGNVTGKYQGYAEAKWKLGTEDQTAFDGLTAISSKWTSAHKCVGVAMLYVKLTRNIDLYARVPEISAVIRGRNTIFDPRTGLRGYSTNAALILADYLTLERIGPGVPYSAINEAALIHAADVCDEDVELLDGGAEKRYSINGTIDMAANVEDNIGVIAQAMGGTLLRVNGQWHIQAAEYIAPTFEITADMLAGGLELNNVQPKKDRANLVKGTYIAEANKWQRFDFPAQSEAAYVEADGQEISRDISFEMVASASQAQRLARIDLENARRGRTLQLRCSLAAMPAMPGGAVLVTLPRYFDRQPFYVAESSIGVDNGKLYVELSLHETAPEIFDWRTAMEHQVNIPDDLNVEAPRCSQPVFSPPPGSFDAGDFPVSVTIASLTSGATIRYSTSAVPQLETDGSAYSGPVAVTSGQTLYAKAFKTGFLGSNPKIGVYE